MEGGIMEKDLDVVLDQQDLTGLGSAGPDVGPDPGESPTLSETESPSPDVPDTQQASEPVDDTDWKSRYSGATREMQRQRQRADGLEASRKRYEDNGLDFGEIDRYIDGTGQPQGQAAPQGDYVSKDQFDSTVREFSYSMAKTGFVAEHPEFKDPEMMRDLDIATRTLAATEYQEHGAIMTPAEGLLGEAAKQVNAKINRWVEKGKRAAMDKREKITKTAVSEGDTKRTVPIDDDAVEYDSQKDYVKGRNAALDKMRNVSLT